MNKWKTTQRRQVLAAGVERCECMGIAATRIAVKQMELVALTTRFMNQRLTAYASFDGRVEPLVRRLEKLTEEYADHYAAQVRAV